MTDYTIYVFEDKKNNYHDLAEPLRDCVDQEVYSIEGFTGEKLSEEIGEAQTSEETGEAQTLEVLQSGDDVPLLVILDAELNEFEWSKIRKPHVMEACSKLDIPVCVYHRVEGEYAEPENIKETEDEIIRVDPKEDSEKMAQSFAVIAKGIREIRESLQSRINEEGDIEKLLEPPSDLLLELADVPFAAEPRLDDYSWGQSEGISAIKESEGKEDMIRRRATTLTYWIHNQLLKYPGALVNPVAAAAYLGVDHEQFAEESRFHDPLEDALYEGPFAELGKWWWITEIDTILAENTPKEENQILSGVEFYDKIKSSEIDPVTCVEGHEGAEYYCILTEKPVCEEHSVSPEGWIPRGATRARISKDEYLKLSGW